MLHYIIAVLMSNPGVAKVVAAKAASSVTKAQEKRIVHLITKYSKRWHIDPVLAACVAARESNFRSTPPPMKYCRTEIRGGSAVEVCKRERREEGMMQTVPWQLVTRKGLWFCFGPTIRSSTTWLRRIALRRPRIGICVGIYELSSCRYWVRRRRIRPRHNRHRRFLKSLRMKYPKRYTRLAEMFWTAGTYNWGPKIRATNNRYDAIGYPIKVLKCYLRYSVDDKAQTISHRPKNKTVDSDA